MESFITLLHSRDIHIWYLVRNILLLFFCLSSNVRLFFDWWYLGIFRDFLFGFEVMILFWSFNYSPYAIFCGPLVDFLGKKLTVFIYTSFLIFFFVFNSWNCFSCFVPFLSSFFTFTPLGFTFFSRLRLFLCSVIYVFFESAWIILLLQRVACHWILSSTCDVVSFFKFLLPVYFLKVWFCYCAFYCSPFPYFLRHIGSIF